MLFARAAALSRKVASLSPFHGKERIVLKKGAVAQFEKATTVAKLAAARKQAATMRFDGEAGLILRLLHAPVEGHGDARPLSGLVHTSSATRAWTLTSARSGV